MSESPLSTLRRIARSRGGPPPPRQCDMCTETVGDEHSHLVDLETRKLMCACRPCYLLFTDDHAHLRYRAVPDRYASVSLDDLEVPVGLAFLFYHSTQERMVLLYPGPAGATESELDIPLPSVPGLRPDVEAVLMRHGFPSYIVPIDACYSLVGRLRTVWKGFDGGSEAHAAIDSFYSDIRKRAR
ncbi:hypothetical protein HH310_13910 [Actinoplanes sp. TBRC 11911]|uniref:DUF5947 family protein n=1 Tax=Actinoplanes sp. TBRC 11911 TaxID=2729386 RepID=UPI00145E0688|nr:DUF5947 family protein [Actinoplanes sp. TBRC 11911]NMO52288.1 hypothetical protein [Actinoplanes sp. TBRC 11911]